VNLETQIIHAPYFNEKTTIHFRPRTSDERVLKEVLNQCTYRKKSIDFDVEEGEHWLDLGGNIGAFAIYCWQRGATCDSYEPEPDCFKILQMNVDPLKPLCKHGHPAYFSCHNSAVTHHPETSIPFYCGKKFDDHYRYTAIKSSRPHPSGSLSNIHAPELFWPGAQISNKTVRPPNQLWDGIKMDIEGSELGLIDCGFIPKVKKLVMEYHLTKDPNMANFRHRMKKLREIFKTVSYIPSLDNPYPRDTYPGFYDRIIFCKN
jgi:FkbM family methyltransferase